jgi:hypothetical protein
VVDEGQVDVNGQVLVDGHGLGPLSALCPVEGHGFGRGISLLNDFPRFAKTSFLVNADFPRVRCRRALIRIKLIAFFLPGSAMIRLGPFQ